MQRKQIYFYLLALIALLVRMHPVSAHEGHKKTQSISVQTNANQSQSPEVKTPESKVAVRPVPLPFSGSFHHAHNRIVHFPLGLGLAGALFVFISLKKPELLTAVKILWFLAALAAAGAYFTGKAQEEPFEDGAMHDVLEVHEKLGIATGIALGTGFLFSLSRRLKGLTVVWAIVVLALISVTGYYGGLLAHS